DEVDVPPLRGLVRSRGWWSDWNQLLRHPRFEPPPGPAEETQGQAEGDDSPGGENRQGRAHVDKAGPFEQDPAQGTDELGQGKGLNERLDRIREPLGREEDA